MCGRDKYARGCLSAGALPRTVSAKRAPCLLGELKGDLKKNRTSKRAGGEGFVGIHQAEVGGGEGRKLCSGQRDWRVQSSEETEQSACVQVCDSVRFWAWGAVSDFCYSLKTWNQSLLYIRHEENLSWVRACRMDVMLCEVG